MANVNIVPEPTTPQTTLGVVIDGSASQPIPVTVPPNTPLPVVVQGAPILDVYWDLIEGPAASGAPTTGLYAVGSRPATANFFASVTNASVATLNSYNRQVAIFGTTTLIGTAQSTFSFAPPPYLASVSGITLGIAQQFVFECEIAALSVPVNNAGGIAGNCVGVVWQQSNGSGSLGTGGVNGLLSSSAPYFAMVAAADGNWYISAGSNGRAGGGPFPPDVVPLTAIASDILNLHLFTFTMLGATKTTDASLTIARDGVTLVTIPWTVAASPHFPPYSSGAVPWWKVGLAGDKSTAGTVGSANLVCASAHAQIKAAA